MPLKCLLLLFCLYSYNTLAQQEALIDSLAKSYKSKINPLKDSLHQLSSVKPLTELNNINILTIKESIDVLSKEYSAEKKDLIISIKNYYNNQPYYWLKRANRYGNIVGIVSGATTLGLVIAGMGEKPHDTNTKETSLLIPVIISASTCVSSFIFSGICGKIYMRRIASDQRFKLGLVPQLQPNQKVTLALGLCIKL